MATLLEHLRIYRSDFPREFDSNLLRLGRELLL